MRKNNNVYLRNIKPGKRIILFIIGLTYLLAAIHPLVYLINVKMLYNIFNLKEIIKFVLFLLIGCFYIGLFYKNNLPSLLVQKIKKKGKMYVGTVLHIDLRQVQNTSKFNKELLIEYSVNDEKRYIVDYFFPYNVQLNENYDKFDPSIIHKQYNSEDNLVIAMDKEKIVNEKENKYRFLSYSGSDNKNFDKPIFCKVYEYNGLYTIDEYIGEGLIIPDDFYDKNKIKKTIKEKRQFIFDIVSVIICICVHFPMIILGMITSLIYFTNLL